MSSTYTSPKAWLPTHHWRRCGLRYFSYKFFLQKHFGTRVQRVSLDGGFACPNADGHIGSEGCIFCDAGSFSPSRRAARTADRLPGISEQLDEGIARLQRRYRHCTRFLAYFQPATNTHAPVERLRAVYEPAIQHPQVVGIAIGTRPDCVPPSVLDLLEAMARQTFVSVEYGVQTSHDGSLQWMNRGHGHDATVDAVTRSHGRGFEIGAHLILGLPAESRQDMVATARELARLGIDAVKLHNLHAVAGTPLADQVRRGDVRLIDRHHYVQAVVDILEVLPPHVVIQRIGGDAPRQYLVGPRWCLDKSGLHRALQLELERRNTWQGKRAAELPPE
ncbi:MAG: TIGR01212 family radical SAM protein [Planctomycetota bacterium]